MAADKSKGRRPVSWRSWQRAVILAVISPSHSHCLLPPPHRGKSQSATSTSDMFPSLLLAPLYPSTFFVRLSGGRMKAGTGSPCEGFCDWVYLLWSLTLSNLFHFCCWFQQAARQTLKNMLTFGLVILSINAEKKLRLHLSKDHVDNNNVIN